MLHLHADDYVLEDKIDALAAELVDNDSDISKSTKNSCASGDYLSDDTINARFGPPQGPNVSSGKASKQKSKQEKKRWEVPPRGLPFYAPFKSVKEYEHFDVHLYRLATVELSDGTFLLIADIIRNTVTDQVTLRGWLFERTTSDSNRLIDRLDLHVNDLYLICRIDLNDKREPCVQSIENVDVSMVRRHRGLRLTNRPWCPEDDDADVLEDVENKGSLSVRRKHVSYFADAKARKAGTTCREIVDQIRPADIPSWQTDFTDDNHLRELWRGPTTKGGSCLGYLLGEREFLRQERFSNTGIKSCASLKTNQYDYPPGDPMKREAVAIIHEDSTDSEDSDSDIIGLRTRKTRTEKRRHSEGPSIESQYSQTSEAAVEIKATTLDGAKHESRTTYAFTPASKRAASLDGWEISQPKRNKQAGVVESTDSDLNTQLKRTSLKPPEKSGRISDAPRPSSSTNTSARSKENNPSPSKTRRYTIFDCFCGCGGWSRGAVMAGMRVVGGFDINENACDSYSRNFLGADVYIMSVDRFLAKEADFFVDIIHISFVCKPWSPLHTRVGKDDEDNIATLYCVSDILEKMKPRILTIENTAGLLHHHPAVFRRMIQSITSKGYNVTWTVLKCADYGVPQLRKRLFVIASCPGEVLPNFPPPTHSKDPATTGLKPWVTINEAIRHVPEKWVDHYLDEYEEPKPPYSGAKITPTICTNPGNVYHPSGRRQFTNREFMCLQTFPLCHKFGDAEIKVQNGNAVPPAMAHAILEHIKGFLLRADGLA